MKDFIFPFALNFFLVAVGWYFIARGVCAILNCINFWSKED